MKKSVILFLFCSFAACAPHRPQLLARTTADLSALPPEAVITETDRADRNFFTIQDYYLTSKSLFRRRPSPEDRQWATAVVKAESEDLAKLLPQAERIVQGPVSPRADKVHGPYFMSFALYLDLVEEGGEEIWETARLRANLASETLGLYWALAAGDTKPEELERLRQSTAKAREELNKAVLPPSLPAQEAPGVKE